MALRKPSQRTIDLYNQLVAQQNKVRKQLRRIHKGAEETLGVGRLPALIIPKSAHKVRQNYFEGLSKSELRRRLQAFWTRMNEAKKLFGAGIRSYLSKTVKEGYMELWRDQILFMSGEEPKGPARMFTKEQIENSYMGEFMQTYNRLNRLSAESFLAMLYHGDIIQFKFIYSEMIGQGNKEYSWLEQQNDLLNTHKSLKNQKELLEQMADYEGKHKKSTIKKAEERKRLAEEDEE